MDQDSNAKQGMTFTIPCLDYPVPNNQLPSNPAHFLRHLAQHI